MELQHREGQAKLIADVVDAGVCVGCGACVGLCPYFDYFNGKVVVMDRCYAEPSKCAQLCPRIDIRNPCLPSRIPTMAEKSENT